ncbi:ESX secretion-associated protein EspG [Mycobacteroides chelonae]|nr:hypothetical protein Chelonae_p0178 [Mycobacterium sp. QIA-37]
MTLRLDFDELELTREITGNDLLPVVLAAGPRHEDEAEHRDALEGARARLKERNLLKGEDLHPTLRDMLTSASKATGQVAVRRWAGSQMLRLCLVEHGEAYVLLVNDGEGVAMRSVTGSLGAELWRYLGDATPLKFGSINAPAEQLALALNAEPAEMARRLIALGATKADAVAVAKAMARRGAMTEITAIRRVDGVTDRAPGGVAVYDTAFGRIMATPSTSADGALWATLTPATPQRMSHALKSLGLE